MGPLALYYDASPSLSTLKLSDLSKQSRAEGINDATGQSDRKWAEYGGCRWPWQTGHTVHSEEVILVTGYSIL